MLRETFFGPGGPACTPRDTDPRGKASSRDDTNAKPLSTYRNDARLRAGSSVAVTTTTVKR